MRGLLSVLPYLTKIGSVCFCSLFPAVLWDKPETPSTNLINYLHSTIDIPINKWSSILNNFLLSQTRETNSYALWHPAAALSFDVVKSIWNKASQWQTSMGLIQATKVHGTHAETSATKTESFTHQTWRVVEVWRNIFPSSQRQQCLFLVSFLCIFSLLSTLHTTTDTYEVSEQQMSDFTLQAMRQWQIIWYQAEKQRLIMLMRQFVNLSEPRVCGMFWICACRAAASSWGLSSVQRYCSVG